MTPRLICIAVGLSIAASGANADFADSPEPTPKSALAFADASDRVAFRSLFVLLADLHFEQPAPEVTDCAALVNRASAHQLSGEQSRAVADCSAALLRNPKNPAA